MRGSIEDTIVLGRTNMGRCGCEKRGRRAHKGRAQFASKHLTISSLIFLGDTSPFEYVFLILLETP
jgi:hypothetical protein